MYFIFRKWIESSKEEIPGVDEDVFFGPKELNRLYNGMLAKGEVLDNKVFEFLFKDLIWALTIGRNTLTVSLREILWCINDYRGKFWKQMQNLGCVLVLLHELREPAY